MSIPISIIFQISPSFWPKLVYLFCYGNGYDGVVVRVNARRLSKLKPNEIFNDFAISREPFNEIDSNFFYFKGLENNTKNRLETITRRFAKLEPNESSSSHILVFKLNNEFNIS